MALLLRAVGHSKAGWLRGWLRATKRTQRLDQRLAAFRKHCRPDRITCTDAVFHDFAELADYIATVHSLCATADFLWDALSAQQTGPSDDDYPVGRAYRD